MRGGIHTDENINFKVRPKRGYRIKNIVVAKPQLVPDWSGERHPSIEDTGLGDILCYEGWGGRLFFSDEGAVEEAVEKFLDDYRQGCLKSEEDPANVYVEVYNFNDLYSLLHILPTHLGDAWGYSTAVDYARDLHFRVELCRPGENCEIADCFHRPVLIIEPQDDDSYPDYYYREL